jgi:hypothetical protein
MVESDDNVYEGRVPSPGVSGMPSRDAGGDSSPNAGLGNPACNVAATPVGRVPSRGAPVIPAPGGAAPGEPLRRRLRRLHRVWHDRNGNISYLLTLCVDGRVRVFDNETTFQRLTTFLLDSPSRYDWFPRRFVVMPDHIHLIAHQGHEAIRLGQWIKALKAVVGGLKRWDEGIERRVGEPGLQNAGWVERPVKAPGLQQDVPVGRVPSPSAAGEHEFTRIKRSWRWQEGFHDHKFRTPESEQRKWEYVCLNPVRYRLVARPEQWPFGGEVFHDEAGGPRLIRGTPPLLETSLLIEEKPTSSPTPGKGIPPPGEGTRPTI